MRSISWSLSAGIIGDARTLVGMPASVSALMASRRRPGVAARGLVSYEGYAHLLSRRFEEAINVFLAEQADLSPKAWPRFVRIAPDLPSTATNKVLKRELASQGPTAGNGELWVREARGRAYRPVLAESPA